MATYLHFVLSSWTLLCSSLRKWTKPPFFPSSGVYLWFEFIKKCLLIKNILKTPSPILTCFLILFHYQSQGTPNECKALVPGDRNCKCQCRPGRTQPTFPATLSLGCWALLAPVPAVLTQAEHGSEPLWDHLLWDKVKLLALRWVTNSTSLKTRNSF